MINFMKYFAYFFINLHFSIRQLFQFTISPYLNFLILFVSKNIESFFRTHFYF